MNSNKSIIFEINKDCKKFFCSNIIITYTFEAVNSNICFMEWWLQNCNHHSIKQIFELFVAFVFDPFYHSTSFAFEDWKFLLYDFVKLSSACFFVDFCLCCIAMMISTIILPAADPHHPRVVHLVVSKISNHLCWSRPKLICSDQIRKTQPPASTIEPQLPSCSKFSETALLGMTSSTHSIQSSNGPATFPVCAIMMIVISFPHEHANTPSDYDTWTKRHRVVQSLTKLHNEI